MEEKIEESFEVVIEATNNDYDPTDDRWIDQVAQLYMDLQNEVGEVRKEVTPQPGTKGLISNIILQLCTSGAVASTSDLFKVWLTRDRSRNLKITIRKEGKIVEEFEMSWKGVKNSDVKDFQEILLNKMREGR